MSDERREGGGNDAADGDSETDIDSNGEIEIEIETDRAETTDMDRSHTSGDDTVDGTSDRADRRLEDLDGKNAERLLEDELGRIDLLTTPEGYVEGWVTGLTSVDEQTVRLEVTLPHDELVDFTLEKPIPWSETFLLARIVEDVGYDASSIGHLVGETVYLMRTDLGDDDEDEDDWLTASVRSLNDALLSSFALDDWFGRVEDGSPQWRLVDPLERPAPEPDGLSEDALALVATGAVLLGTIGAVLGAILGATGAMLVSSAALGYALPGILLVLIGLWVFLRKTV